MALTLSFGCPGDDVDGTGKGPTMDGGTDGLADRPVDSIAIDSPPAFDMPAADGRDVADGPEDGPACSAGLKPFYRDPGCGGDAVIFCAASDDGCLGPEICTCEGKTSRLCSWSEKPFRHYGACGTDGGQERPLTWPI